MRIFSWIARAAFSGADISMYGGVPAPESIGAQYRNFMKKGSFIELRISAEEAVKGNEARASVGKGGSEVSAG